MKVLVIVADGFHLGYLGCYGNDWVATPALDRLAAEGIVFDQHYADRPDAGGARQAWRTGNYSFPGSSASLDCSELGAQHLDLLHLLQSGGIVRTLIIDHETSKEFGSGWSRIYDLPTTSVNRAPVEQVLETTLTAIDALSDREDWLLWVETRSLLPPWNVPESFLELYFDNEDEEENVEPLNSMTDPMVGFIDKTDDGLLMRLQRTYAAAVSYFDSGLEALFEELRSKNLMDAMMIVITTDRSFPLGEHGILGWHRPWLHEEMIHLPLLVKLPGGAEAGRRISALTQPVDLMPTLLDACGRQIPDTHGYSLLPLTRGEKDSLRSYAACGLRMEDGCEWALRTKEWAFILPLQSPSADAPRSVQLYVKPDDRWEINNVWQHNIELSDNLEQILRGFVEVTRRPGPLRALDVEAQGLQPPGLAQSNQKPGETQS